MNKYILAYYSIRDGEIEYEDKMLVKLVTKIEISDEEIEKLIQKEIGTQKFGKEDEDWEINNDEQIEGCGGEYRIAELEDYNFIPKEHFNILELYLGSTKIVHESLNT